MLAADVIQIQEISAWIAMPVFVVLFFGGLAYGLRWILRAPEA